jgi:STE24 endopeptidase
MNIVPFLMNVEENAKASAYFKRLGRAETLYWFLIGISWAPLVALWTIPVGALVFSLCVILFSYVLVSLLHYDADRKYKEVAASRTDYLKLNASRLAVSAVPVFLILGSRFIRAGFNLASIALAEGAILLVALLVFEFPSIQRLGKKASPVADQALLSAFRRTAGRMGVDNVDLYSLAWSRFKIANAFQAGPRKFSVFVSDYLLNNMTAGEINAVLAHELAHAKMKHVAKIFAMIMGSVVIGSSLLLLGLSMLTAGIGDLLSIAGLLVIFLGPQVAAYLSRRFELEADEVAVRTLGEGKSMVDALRRLSELDLIPGDRKSPTHPPLSKRIERIEAMALPVDQHS